MPKAEHVARLLADLDAEEFDKREQASSELRRLGPLVESSVRKALANTTSAEVRRRLTEILADLDGLRGERLRQWRALAALERSAAPTARALLQTLAEGDAEVWLTAEARSSLRHLKK